ncbi:unnamed protein product [marine sediment metagenome]|uniref:N-acetyltransferase domain-containing protein n=1 Tax=marine sediment metagenome TaxID=412755 RepID=X0VH68_9ZZZZ
MKVSKVLLKDHLEDIKRVLPTHHEEVENSGWVINPDWLKYQELEDSGSLLVHVVYDGLDLVGYSVDVISDSLHYKGKRVSVNDGLYINPAYRGLGLNRIMMDAVLAYLRSEGIDSYTQHRKTDHPGTITMKKSGFEQVEVVWHKILET